MTTAFGVLGPLVVRDAAGADVPLGGQKPRELLAVLLLHRGEILPVGRLVDCLWGAEASSGAATTLRTYVGQVRRILAEAGAVATLDSRAGGYVLQADVDAIDADRFEQLLREGQEAAGRNDSETAGRLVGEALALWRGEMLADLGGPEFTLPSIARYEELRLVAWEAWLDAELALGRHRSVVTRLQALVDEHPFRERFSAQLMLALYRSGRQAEALAVSAATRLRLADELGLDPGPELRELETSMLRQSPELDAAPVPRPTGGPVAEAGLAGPARTDQPEHLELLERERERSMLADAIARAVDGRGAGIAIAGDAGSGKSTLVQVACADGPRLRVLRASCDPLSTPRPLGPFRDVADAAGLTTLTRGEDVLLSAVCEEALTNLRTEPTVLVVEDIHWIDAASVDVLRFLARRIESMPLALVVTYRDHEVGARHPARPLLGDLARLDGHATIELTSLSTDGVRRLIEGSDLDAERVHALTGGNPYFVTEVMKDPDRPLPTSVRDAVLARTADVAPEDVHVLQLVAAAPDRLDDRVLPVLGVDLPTLGRLEVTGLLTRTGGGLAYRHELARQAVESTVPAGAGPRLHGQLLDALEHVDEHDPAILTHHAVAAGDRARALHYAVAAADQSAGAGAHTEAVAFLEIAVASLPATATGERAGLLHRLAYEQYMISRLAEAIDNVRASIPLWEQVGDRAHLATAHDNSAVFEYYQGHRRIAEAHAEVAASIASEAGAEVERGAAQATRGFLAYLRSDLPLAADCSGEAIEIAGSTEHELLGLRAELISILSRLAAGDGGERGRMEDHIANVRAAGWDELASTGYSQLASVDVEQRRLDEAAEVLEESLPFAVSRDIPICVHWQMHLRSRVHFGQGRWVSALQDVDHVLAQEGMPVAKIWPSIIATLVPLRRGEDVDPAHLDYAWNLGDNVDEPLRRLALLSALAEITWTTGAADERVSELAGSELARLAGVPGAGWAVGDLAVWLHRLGLLDDTDAPMAEPYRATLDGRHGDAADWWREHGEPFNEAMALADSTDPADRVRALVVLDELGSAGTTARLRSESNPGGVPEPRRPADSAAPAVG